MEEPASSNAPSRFVSQKDLSDAQRRREEEIRAAYERIGQEPPPEAPAHELNDTRSLYERLQEARELKQERMDEKFKLANQYRGLNESESTFLAEIERERKRRDQEMRKSDFEELSAFRRATGRSTEPPSLPGGDAARPSFGARKTGATAKRKRDGASALGIVRKSKPAPSTESAKDGKAKGEAEPKAETKTADTTKLEEEAQKQKLGADTAASAATSTATGSAKKKSSTEATQLDTSYS